MSYTVGSKKFDLMSEAIAESAGTGEKVMSGSKTIHTPKEFKMMKNPLFGFGKKSPSKSGFEIAEEVFQSHNGQVDFETFWKEFSPSQPGMRMSEARSIHADLSKQNWRFMRNGSAKKCNYKVIGQNDRVLYDGYSFEKASDLMMRSAAPVRMLRDDVEISRRRPAGDVRRNGSKKNCVYKLLGRDGRSLYEGPDLYHAVDIRFLNGGGTILCDEVDISKTIPKGKKPSLSASDDVLCGGVNLGYRGVDSKSVRRNGMSMTRSMPDGSKRDTYSVNCGNKSYHTEDLADAKRKFKSWCKTGDCTLHHGRKLLDSNFEQPAPKPLGLFLHAPGYRPPVKRNGSGFTATHKKILKDYIEAGGNAHDFDDLPSSIRSKLKAAGYPETLESDAERFLWDNNNPHLKRSKLWGNPRKIDQEVLSKYKYNVVVGNEDGVEAQYGRDERAAIEDYFKYHVKESKNPRSRFFKMTVTMFCDGEVCKSYNAPEQSMERNPRKNYEVVVGNIGTVYRGNSLREASRCHSEYVKQSKMSSGRASGEDVTMFCDSEICKSYDAPDRPRF